MSYEFPDFAPQGWQCPICKRVYSPFTSMCWYCGNNKQYITNSTESGINPGFVPSPKFWSDTRTYIDKKEQTNGT